MAIQTPLTPLPPLFYWGHLSTFPQFLQEAEASAQTLLSVFQELDQQVRSGRAERGCSRGLSCPVQGTGGRHRTHLIVPWTIEGSRSLPSSFHPCFQHHTIFYSCDRSCEQNHTLTQPAWTGLKAQTSETIYIFTPPQRVQTYQLLLLTFAMGIVTY